MEINDFKVPVKGKPIDKETRCIHYHSVNDIIAIKFKCCDQFFPCYSCHEETADHVTQRWPLNEWNTKAILCGSCKHQMTIEEYMKCNNQCLNCQSSFNPNCSKHYHLYFEL